MKYIVSSILLSILLMSLTVHAQTTVDATVARDTILNGVTTIHSGEGTGYMVVYGDNAAPISYFPEGAAEGSTVAVAEWGSGRVLAMPDHQMLSMGAYGDDGTTGQFYKNGLAWVTNDTSQAINVVTYNQGTADWLNTNGYPNATAINESGLINALTTADVFVGWLGSSQSQNNLDALATFVQNGGGLMLAEYGAGYTFWWTHTPVYDAPGNKLLRDIGIGFSSRNRGDSGLIAVNRANEQVTIDDYYTIMGDQAAATAEQIAAAIQLLAHIGDTLPPNDPLPGQMEAAFTSDVRATINTPVTDPTDKATLSAEMDILRNLPPSQVTAHPTAEELYGAIPASAPRLSNQTVTIDTDTSRWHSTGLYVVPGEIVEVVVPTAIINNGFRVLVSGHGDDISPNNEWLRVPYGVQREFAADTTTIEIANAFGGAIYFDVGAIPPADYGVADFDITINNGIAAPYFVLGETTNADWIASIRDNPAPYAEFVSDQIAFSVPSSSIRNLDEAEQLLQLWDDVVAVQDYVGGFEELRTMPERINNDVQISVGYLHAGYPIQGPTHTTTQLTDYAEIKQNGSWGYYHELGHEMQRRPDKLWGGWDNPYTFSGDVEVTVNIFSNVALETLNPTASPSDWGYSGYPDLVMEKAITSVSVGGVFDFKDPYPFYFQLADGFGWDAYRTVMKTYHNDVLNNPGALPVGNTAEKTEWLMRWSQAVGYDMRCYMVDVWGLQVSLTSTQESILNALPCWLPAVIGNTPDQVVEVSEPTPLDFKGDALAIDNDVTVLNVTSPINGSLQSNGNGLYMYTATALGVETLTYTLQNSLGTVSTYTVELTALVCPDPLVVVSVADSGACTLRNAIENGSADDTITFAPSIAGQTITVTTALIVDKPLTIDGAGMTLSGGNSTGVLDVSADITLRNVNIVEGRSGTGAMIVRWNTTATIENSTFANNQTTLYDGGAIHSQGTLRIYNSTFSGNSATQGGSALGLRGGGHEIINSTFVSNISPNLGAIQLSDGTVATIHNTIIAQNSMDCSGVPFSVSGGNWFGDTSCDGIAQGDPMLGPLQDNGGFILTHKPIVNSPVIDAGDQATCLAVDQLGSNRLVCDIGAVEGIIDLFPTPSPTATSTPLPTATNTPQPTATNTPLPTATNTPRPTATNTPFPMTPVTVFSDSFENNQEWTVNPNGSDTATTGLWEIADPQGTVYQGSKQLDNAYSGIQALVTAGTAGSGVGSYDIDNGETSIWSPQIALPANRTIDLSFAYYMAHTFNSSADDYLYVSIVGSGGTTIVLEELGNDQNDDGAWLTTSLDISQFAGQTIRLLIAAADSGGGSIVEAAVDDINIVATSTNGGGSPTPTPTPSASTILFEDDFEGASNWALNPNGTDDATTGHWGVYTPQQTSYDGVKQVGTAYSGVQSLMTDGRAGSGVGTYDIDNGTTTIQSPPITIPAGNYTLSFAYYMAHTFNSSADDFLRVSIVGNSTVVVLDERGDTQNDNAVWATHQADLSQFAGQTVQIVVEAADNANGSIVETAIDDVVIALSSIVRSRSRMLLPDHGTMTDEPPAIQPQDRVNG